MGGQPVSKPEDFLAALQQQRAMQQQQALQQQRAVLQLQQRIQQYPALQRYQALQHQHQHKKQKQNNDYDSAPSGINGIAIPMIQPLHSQRQDPIDTMAPYMLSANDGGNFWRTAPFTLSGGSNMVPMAPYPLVGGGNIGQIAPYPLAGGGNIGQIAPYPLAGGGNIGQIAPYPLAGGGNIGQMAPYAPPSGSNIVPMAPYPLKAVPQELHTAVTKKRPLFDKPLLTGEQHPKLRAALMVAERQRAHETALKRVKIDSSIALDSVKHLISHADSPIRHTDPVPRVPDILRKKSSQLSIFRSDDVWKDGTRDEQVTQMPIWFPDVFGPGPTPDQVPSKKRKRGLVIPTEPLTRDRPCPSSDIGVFDKLPGELRNLIWRFAVIEDDDPVKISLAPKTCGEGPCLHVESSYNLPAIANTCKQLQWEILPIYTKENEGFQFDDGTVQQRCVGNFIRSLGDYADSIPEFEFILKRPLWNEDVFLNWATYSFTIINPWETEDCDFILEQSAPDGQKVCQCALDSMVEDMNERFGSVLDPNPDPDDVYPERVNVSPLVRWFADSDGFSDFVWRMRKSKQWSTRLRDCDECGEVIFND